MKKLVLALSFCLLAAGISFAEPPESRVYIGANISQSFENFSYDSFVDTFAEKESDSGKILDGPRYDFVLGYRLGKKLRAEAQYLIISENSFDTDKTNSKVEYKASAVFANLIYDFWDMQDNLITPFIGAGIGVGSPNLTLNYDAIKKEADENGFTWQIQAGLNVKLLNWLIVNVKYTYLSMPGIENSIDSNQLGNNDYLESEFKKGVQSVGLGVTLLL